MQSRGTLYHDVIQRLIERAAQVSQRFVFFLRREGRYVIQEQEHARAIFQRRIPVLVNLKFALNTG